jgi:Txe/YoeB family toxin of Txe-Axe toxin-antitoxin module
MWQSLDKSLLRTQMEIKLDGETADRITALTLNEHREMFKGFISEGKLHDEDRGRYHRYIDAIDMLLSEYFQVPQ